MNICIFEPFRAYSKVGVDHKILVDMSCFWRTKIVCFTSFKDQFNPRKWKKIAESTKLWSGELCNMRYFYSLSLQKFDEGAEVMKWFSSWKMLFRNILKNQCGFNYFWSKIYSWAKFKGNWFSDPKRSGPVWGRLSHSWLWPFVQQSISIIRSDQFA